MSSNTFIPRLPSTEPNFRTATLNVIFVSRSAPSACHSTFSCESALCGVAVASYIVPLAMPMSVFRSRFGSVLGTLAVVSLNAVWSHAILSIDGTTGHTVGWAGALLPRVVGRRDVRRRILARCKVLQGAA